MKSDDFRLSEIARKRPVNLTVTEELLAAARKCKLNLFGLLEDSLITELKARWHDQWLDENRAAIAGYNERIAKHGVFSDGIRRF